MEKFNNLCVQQVRYTKRFCTLALVTVIKNIPSLSAIVCLFIALPKLLHTYFFTDYMMKTRLCLWLIKEFNKEMFVEYRKHTLPSRIPQDS